MIGSRKMDSHWKRMQYKEKGFVPRLWKSQHICYLINIILQRGNFALCLERWAKNIKHYSSFPSEHLDTLVLSSKSLWKVYITRVYKFKLLEFAVWIIVWFIHLLYVFLIEGLDLSSGRCFNLFTMTQEVKLVTMTQEIKCLISRRLLT